jgi:hypothetical protein
LKKISEWRQKNYNNHSAIIDALFALSQLKKKEGRLILLFEKKFYSL